ncbi:holo-[acyl-carrier-protein] synthase [Spiroplasma alleghenense]|uniref:Holo-[acyl-carrier-protein] synthase n=2 Tax=Spiroplasma alleghenense TaxID=216931 RepID=A0A345Z3V1_9MOLU|nr:4'-phosphopantetheinyl transferase superfamily protein [Spiroplasma alleghenense]AXK51280.1 holo-[acyl-carrier-protein] synthase [Spiroplasma alleghenense]
MKKIGIDIVAVKRIKLKPRMIELILHPDEIKILSTRLTKNSKREFLAGRWAVKEAIIKTLPSPIAMNQINIGYIDQKPSLKNSKFGEIIVSISHEKRYAVGMALKKD